ncbi:MAG: SUMF1/EgtB/PvdO family nonheme iron enzyme [Terriglobia bacterium]
MISSGPLLSTSEDLHVISRFSETSLSHVASVSGSQAQLDGLVAAFADQATDSRAMVAMVAGGVAYQLGKVGALSLLESKAAFPLFSIVSAGAGLSAEVTTYEAVSSTLAPSLLEREGGCRRRTGEGGFWNDWASSFFNFSLLKIAGKAATRQNVILRHLLQDGAMVVGENLASTSHETLSQQFLRAEAINLQSALGLAVAHRSIQEIGFLERSLALSFSVAESPFVPQRDILVNESRLFAFENALGMTAPESTSASSLTDLKGPLLVRMSSHRPTDTTGSMEVHGNHPHEAMVCIPGGEFIMGSSLVVDAPPIRRVKISPFLMRKTPVTKGEYQAFVNDSEERRLPWALMGRDQQTHLWQVIDRGKTQQELVSILLYQYQYPNSWVYTWRNSETGIRQPFDWADSHMELLQRAASGKYKGMDSQSFEALPPLQREQSFLDMKVVQIIPDNWQCPGDPHHPAVNVNFWAAAAYANIQGGRLPTEAEWEYAARGPMHLFQGDLVGFRKWAETRENFIVGRQVFQNSEDSELHNHVNNRKIVGAWGIFPTHNGGYNDQEIWGSVKAEREGTRSVRQGVPNSWGVVDMGGNVRQWVMDDYQPYQGLSEENPISALSHIYVPPTFWQSLWGGKGNRLVSKYTVTRGGAWSSADSGFFQSAQRGIRRPDALGDHVGFTVVKPQEE